MHTRATAQTATRLPRVSCFDYPSAKRHVDLPEQPSVQGSQPSSIRNGLLGSKLTLASWRHRFRFSVFAAAIGSSISAPAQVPKVPALFVRVDQIRGLSPEQAAIGYPVHIRGVITMDAPAPDFFIQD